jgi:tryptophan synthase alpha chain
MPVKNRLTELLKSQQKNLLTIYFTAGYPHSEDTLPILETLAEAGADIVEIGMPFSDPIADGPTIQESNQTSLEQGMTIEKLFTQLEGFRENIHLPVLLMGYLNPVMQYGIEKFCQKASELGVDGLILPDLPMFEYQNQYKELFQRYQLSHIFLITPETSDERIRVIDAESEGFIYAVSSSSTTGKTGAFSTEQEAYFERLQTLNLNNPILIGFGIADHATYLQACKFGNGAIIGSAFIRTLAKDGEMKNNIKEFIKGVKNQ